MELTMLRPSRPLAPFVELLWLFRSDRIAHAHERVLPTGKVQLLINLDADEIRWSEIGEGAVHRRPGACLAGLTDSPLTIDTRQQRWIAGVVLRPGAVAPLFDVGAHELAHDHVPLADLWHRTESTRLRAQMAEHSDPHQGLRRLHDALLVHLRPERADGQMRRAAEALADGARVAAVAAEAGMSSRRFRDRFRASVGLAPKSFAMVARFQRLLRCLPEALEPDWAELAVGCGYYDQAHLIRDFRRFTGLTPTDYCPRAPGDFNHVPT